MRHFILTIIITLFVGCGSSPTSKVETPDASVVPQKQETPDTAEAVFTIGDDQNVLEGSSVKLSASMLDKTKEFARYSWKVDGKTISSAEELQPKTYLQVSIISHLKQQIKMGIFIKIPLLLL